jgi:hypothetical protein
VIPTQTILQQFQASGISPNTRPSLENIIFDPTYYGLTALIVVLALAATLLSLRLGRRSADEKQRVRATGTGIAALGFVVVFIATTTFLALLRAGALGGILYQQAQFSVAYVGIALMLYGVERAVTTAETSDPQPNRANRERKLRAAIWIAFAVSVVVAFVYLFNPSTYTVTESGGTQHVAQQGIFWLPAFVAFAAGVGGLPVLALVTRDATARRHAIWFGLFFVIELLGILKESLLIPSSGDPFVDLLAAFIPFTVGGLCLLASALSLRSPGFQKNAIEDALPNYRQARR